MALYVFTGSIPAASKRAEIDLSMIGMHEASRCALLLVQVKVWAPGAAGGYSFQPSIFNTDFAVAGFMGDAHLDEAPSLCWGAVAMAAVVNNKVFVGAHDEPQLRPIVSSDAGKIWLFPSKDNAGEVTQYEVVLCTDP